MLQYRSKYGNRHYCKLKIAQQVPRKPVTKLQPNDWKLKPHSNSACSSNVDDLNNGSVDVEHSTGNRCQQQQHPSCFQPHLQFVLCPSQDKILSHSRWLLCFSHKQMAAQILVDMGHVKKMIMTVIITSERRHQVALVSLFFKLSVICGRHVSHSGIAIERQELCLGK